jgi:branched-chain amino acid transport system permease protein
VALDAGGETAMRLGAGTSWRRALGRLNGPQTLGRSGTFWAVFCAVVLGAYLYPLWGADYDVSNFAYLLVWVFLGLSVCILWGYTGVFSFGQTAFFGLAGYMYGVIAVNVLPAMGNTNLAVVGALAFAALIALVIGYIMFYGGVSSLYVAIFTLMLTLLAETFMSRTSGPDYQIGAASLGGSNGMVGIPPMLIGAGDWTIELVGKPFYYLVLSLLVAVYLGLRVLLNSNWGYVLVAAREDALRTEMFGYDVRLVYLLVFVLAGVLAGLSGVLYVSWNNYISPSSMGLTAATLPVIWVAAGGRKSILAVVIATFLLQWLNQYLAYTGTQYSLLFFACLILATVLVFPDGLIPTAVRVVAGLGRWSRSAPPETRVRASAE